MAITGKHCHAHMFVEAKVIHEDCDGVNPCMYDVGGFFLAGHYMCHFQGVPGWVLMGGVDDFNSGQFKVESVEQVMYRRVVKLRTGLEKCLSGPVQ